MRDSVITVRLTEDEKGFVTQAAGRSGLPAATFVRMAVMNEAKDVHIRDLGFRAVVAAKAFGNRDANEESEG